MLTDCRNGHEDEIERLKIAPVRFPIGVDDRSEQRPHHQNQQNHERGKLFANSFLLLGVRLRGVGPEEIPHAGSGVSVLGLGIVQALLGGYMVEPDFTKGWGSFFHWSPA